MAAWSREAVWTGHQAENKENWILYHVRTEGQHCSLCGKDPGAGQALSSELMSAVSD